jgi:hypothetical protein
VYVLSHSHTVFLGGGGGGKEDNSLILLSVGDRPSVDTIAILARTLQVQGPVLHFILSGAECWLGGASNTPHTNQPK